MGPFHSNKHIQAPNVYHSPSYPFNFNINSNLSLSCFFHHSLYINFQAPWNCSRPSMPDAYLGRPIVLHRCLFPTAFFWMRNQIALDHVQRLCYPRSFTNQFVTIVTWIFRNAGLDSDIPASRVWCWPSPAWWGQMPLITANSKHYASYSNNFGRWWWKAFRIPAYPEMTFSKEHSTRKFLRPRWGP